MFSLVPGFTQEIKNKKTKKKPFTEYNERVWQLNGLLKEAVKGIHGQSSGFTVAYVVLRKTFLPGMGFI